MNELRLGLRENRTTFSPGDTIAGAADWSCSEAPTSAEVRLCWYTRGKGTEDAAIVGAVSLPNPAKTDLRQYSLVAPHEPYSFSGKLVSLLWAVELVLQPGDRCERVDIVIAPDRREIVPTAFSTHTIS